MTIDEAIKLCGEGSKDTWNGHQTRNGEIWQQMAEWLKELKTYREAPYVVARATIKEYLDRFGKDTNVTITSELSSIRHELLERKDELVSFGQLIERFDDVDAEYGGSPWTLEQIYANFNILIGIESVESPSYNGVKTELEPCEDCISRQAAIVALDDRMSSLENVDMQIAMGFAKGIIHELPPVAPWPKMGRWIGVNPMVDTLMCSECGENIISEEFKSNYCPNCGAKMSEVEE